MLAFIVNRILQAVGVMLVVALAAFYIANEVGDPVANLLGLEATHEERAQARLDLGLDDPVPLRFARFVGDMMRGNFGVSYQFRRKVSDLIVERTPATLELVAVAAVFAMALGILLGVYTGLRRNAISSRIIMTVSLVGVSLPTFVIGILLIFTFAVDLGWLPSFGRGDKLGEIFGYKSNFLTRDGWAHLVLPAVTLGLFNLALILRLVRSGMLEVLRTDYIKFARARGLTARAVHYGHALKNTLVPVITVAGIQIGTLIAFSTVTESVFQWPGLGQLFIAAVQFADVPVMTAYLVVAAAIFVLVNFVVDLLYAAIDPRLRAESKA